MEKVTFGTDLPGFIAGPKGAPAVIVIQVLGIPAPPRLASPISASTVNPGRSLTAGHELDRMAI